MHEIYQHLHKISHKCLFRYLQSKNILYDRNVSNIQQITGLLIVCQEDMQD